MYQLKKISSDYIPTALEKAEKYRLMNHPKMAESICRDVLEVDPENQDAIAILIVSVTEQFSFRKKYNVRLRSAQEWIPRLADNYKKNYLSGLILERWAKSNLHIFPGADLYEYFHEALEFYQKAEPDRPPGDESCLLHWNNCLRIMADNPHIKPGIEEQAGHLYGDGFIH